MALSLAYLKMLCEMSEKDAVLSVLSLWLSTRNRESSLSCVQIFTRLLHSHKPPPSHLTSRRSGDTVPDCQRALFLSHWQFTFQQLRKTRRGCGDEDTDVRATTLNLTKGLSSPAFCSQAGV